jgi:sarcosine oxidase subunit alpha
MRRLEGVEIAQTEKRRPIKGTERFVPCDTLLLSLGLIPENELAREAGITLSPITNGPLVDENCMTDLPGVFSCGNALHVHDLVDWVSDEAERAGRAAAKYLSGGGTRKSGELGVAAVKLRPGSGVRYVMPDRIVTEADGSDVTLLCRVPTPAKDGKVRVILRDSSGGVNTLKEEKHARLHPAEMIKITLSAAETSHLKVGDVVEVETQ